MKMQQTQLIKLYDMTPKGNVRNGIEQKSVNLAPTSPQVIEEKSVDLLSVTSDDYKDEDLISFDEGRLQAWHSGEFKKQLWGALAAIVLLLGCGFTSTWAISDLIKDIQLNEAEWVDIDYSFELFDNDDEEFLSSRHVIIAMVVLSFNFGNIIGAILGAFLTPILPNRAIYVCCLVFHIFFLKPMTCL